MLSGVACAPGRAAGRLWLWPRPSRGEPPPVGSHGDRLDAAWRAVSDQLAARQARLSGQDHDAKGMLDVQRWLLVDPHFAGQARDLVDRGVAAERAIEGAIDHAVATLLAPGDPVLASRCADVHQLGERLLGALKGRSTAVTQAPGPVVLAARDLPADVLLELIGPTGTRTGRRIRALLLERGGPLTHTCILARQRGVPVVGGLTGLLGRVQDQDGALVDGHRGEVTLRPDRTSVARFRSRSRPSTSRGMTGGHSLQLLANLDLPEDVARARQLGAEGIGLLRTDGMIGPGGPPGVDEQARRYGTVLRAWPGTTVVIRLFDAPVAGPEPALGPRGIRWLRLEPARTRDQLRALCKAAQASPKTRLAVLAPMVSHRAELVELRELLAVTWTGPQAPPLLGAMVETPAAALDIEGVLDVADFVSVGSNDLLQLLVGASRDDPRVAGLLDPSHPALWRLLGQVAAAARARGRRCLLCGALAADPGFLPRVAALGFSGLSVGLADLRRVRRQLGGHGVDTATLGS